MNKRNLTFIGIALSAFAVLGLCWGTLTHLTANQSLATIPYTQWVLTSVFGGLLIVTWTTLFMLWKGRLAQDHITGKADRFYSILEGASTYFMMCDLNLVITYCNPAVIEMLRKYQNDIRKFFPSFDPDKLVGTCIDSFHKNPSHQRSLLGDPKRLPYSSELTLGHLEFGVNATALFDADGKHIGNGVEWKDFNDRAKYRNETTKVLEAAREGDLTVRGDLSQLTDTYRPMMEGINQLLDNFEAAIAKITEPTTQVSSASREITEGAQRVADGASTQASAIEQISASLQEISSMTGQNADNATQANTLSQQAVDSADRGSESMQKMDGAINKIKASSDETAKIVKTIDEIAFQTNLLALNAAVEAARAGDAGKGFAVVAEEVRNLAQRSAEAAKNTAARIEEAVQNAQGGVSITEEVRTILGDIVSGSKKVNDLISEIAAASSEQADGIKQVSEAISNMDQVTQENSANSEQSAAAASQLNDQATQLNHLIAQYRVSNGNQAATLDAVTPTKAPSARARTAPAARSSGSHRSGVRPDAVLPLDDDDLADF